MLETIMEKQKDLQERLGTDFNSLSDEERAAFMRNHRGYLEDELAEALYEMPEYKLWKDYSNMSEEDRADAWDKVKMELVDALHFFVNLLLCAGFTAEEVLEMYLAKNNENHRRQDEGYTADKSYRGQAVKDVLLGMPHKADDKASGDMPVCSVDMHGNATTSTDFVTVLFNKDDTDTIYYSTSVLGIGIAAKRATETFYAELEKLSADEKAQIEKILFEGANNG